MQKKEKVKNYKLKAFLTEFGLNYDDLSNVINKSRSSVSKKIENKTLTQNEMILILNYLKILDKNIDMNIFF